MNQFTDGRYHMQNEKTNAEKKTKTSKIFAVKYSQFYSINLDSISNSIRFLNIQIRRSFFQFLWLQNSI